MVKKRFFKITIIIVALLIITSVAFGDRISELYNKDEVEIIKSVKSEDIIRSISHRSSIVKIELTDDYSKYNLELGYRLYTLNYGNVVNSSSEKLEELIKPLDRWEYIVTYEGKPISVVTVAKEDDEYKVVKMGGYNKSNIRSKNLKKLTKDKYEDIKLILYNPGYTTYIARDKHGKYKVIRETDTSQEKKEFNQFIKDLRSDFKKRNK